MACLGSSPHLEGTPVPGTRATPREQLKIPNTTEVTAWLAALGPCAGHTEEERDIEMGSERCECLFQAEPSVLPSENIFTVDQSSTTQTSPSQYLMALNLSLGEVISDVGKAKAGIPCG